MACENGRIPREEIRFAVVLNGGVSLAVWMGGAVLELDRVTRGESVYGHLLRMVGCTARADVITGTSAGGINGAALALSQVNKNARLDQLRDLWAEQGRMDQLLRTPFHGQPASLLRGDEFFLPRLKEALARLVAGWEPRPAEERPIDLRITTTLLQPVPQVTFDDLGQALTQSNHQCTFSFRRDPAEWAHPAGDRWRDDFAQAELSKRVAQLALAARSSASFPFAFEPSFVPVRAVDGDGRPDMAGFASWGDGEADRSRYAVDGGVLVNTPTRQALEAIDRMPAGGPVRRVMLLVFPHAEPVGPHQKADRVDTVPTTLATGGLLLGALRSQGARTYVEKIEEHNRLAASRRGSREELLERLKGPDPVGTLYSLADALHPHYRDLRIRRAARDLASRQLEVTGSNTAQWSFERIREAAEQAQRDWPAELPYVPDDGPPAVSRDVGWGNRGWRWGFGMVEELTSAVMNLLERLVWVVPNTADGPLAGACGSIAEARERLHRARFAVRELREALDAKWTGPQSPTLGVPYWAERLAEFRRLMVGDRQLEIGCKVREQVNAIGDAVVAAQRVLAALSEEQRETGGLEAWNQFLSLRITPREGARGLVVPRVAPPADAESRERWSTARWRPVLLSRLLALEVAATCLADEARTGHDQAVELVQISLQTENAFAEYSTTPDGKAGGTALGRFGGFLKRSWRVNDWIWGRLDSATTLCRILLDQRRLRRVAVLERKVVEPPEQPDQAVLKANEARLDELVEQELAALTAALFGAAVPDEPSLRDALAAARKELRLVFDGRVEMGQLDASSPGLAKLAAWGLHTRIAAEELPHLRAAVVADDVEGADQRSNGKRFIKEHENLLVELGKPETRADDPATAATWGVLALKAFDRAGVGRESLGQEVSSDQSLRTAATAAAVAVTVADSDNSGLGVLRPVTRTVRGAALLPYWAIVGLTKGGRVARVLGVLGLALGGFALALALIGALRDGAGSMAAALGTAALLGAFGYAALRTGSVLHGVALLAPVLPLVGHALQVSIGAESAPTLPAVSTILGITTLVVGLMVIGTLPAPLRTPLAVLAKRRVSPAATEVDRPGLFVGLVGAVVLLAVLVIGLVLDRPDVLWIAGAITALLAVAAVIASWGGTRLRRWRRQDEGTWSIESAVHPAATTAGWGVVYGAIFLGSTGLLLLFKPGTAPDGGTVGRWLSGDWWALGALVTSALLAVVFTLVTPWFVPLRARRRIKQNLLGEATRAVYQSREKTREVLRSQLEGRGMLYRYLAKNGGDGVVLTRKGEHIVTGIQDRLWPSASPAEPSAPGRDEVEPERTAVDADPGSPTRPPAAAVRNHG